MQNFMEYISQLCYTVTNNPKSQWLKATKFYFLLTLEPGCRPGSACCVTQADREAPVLVVPPHGRRNRRRGLAEPAPTHKASAQMRPLSHLLTCHWPMKALVSAPHQWGEAVHSSPGRCCKSHSNRNGEWTTAHNNRMDNVPEDSSLASQVVLQEDFPQSFTAPFALLTNKPTGKENVEKISHLALQPQEVYGGRRI